MAKRVVSGVLLLDKPAGMSSHTALSQAKRLLMSAEFDSKKAGHTGTLDPMATGLLPICLGEATKFSQFGLDANKGYKAVIKLGSQTDTGDATGQVMATAPILNITQDELDAVARQFLGQQKQVPPMYSALKKDGKKLYEYARLGIDVERQARPIHIHRLSLNKISDDEIELVVNCSKGTYVRVLGECVADALGTVGHLSVLQRTLTGGFLLDDAIGLEALGALGFDERLARLLPVDAMVSHLPKMHLDTHEAKRVCMGQRLNVRHKNYDVSNDHQVRLYHDGRFVGLGELSATGRLQPIRILSG
ncbi:MAG: tRNA pseudouridine(55) synthase TruB [Moraxella sp.]|nr:tRNA pseudouridine(55) synthase TruB [Moraxella sp.]